MIPVLQSGKSSKSTHSLSSKPLSNRDVSFSSNTINGSMTNLLSLFSVAIVSLFSKIPSILLRGAPHHFIYNNNGRNGQYQCKICGQTFSSAETVTSPIRLTCPHCGNILVAKKDRKFFHLHKCVNPKCPYYLHNMKKVDQKGLDADYGKNK